MPETREKLCSVVVALSIAKSCSRKQGAFLAVLRVLGMRTCTRSTEDTDFQNFRRAPPLLPTPQKSELPGCRTPEKLIFVGFRGS